MRYYFECSARWNHTCIKCSTSWPSDAIWRHKTGFPYHVLAKNQVWAWRLAPPIYYSNHVDSSPLTPSDSENGLGPDGIKILRERMLIYGPVVFI